MNQIGITTDCVCDLPEAYLKAHDIGIIYFYIETATGKFQDGHEITSRNILEYLENGGEKAETAAPEPLEYKAFFEKALQKNEQIIHIAISSHVSLSFQNASLALEMMGEDGKKVTIIDSRHLSTGMGHMVIRAAELRDAGKPADEITGACEAMRSKISTSFLTQNVDYLYRNGRVSKMLMNLTHTFRIHPVLTVKDGKMTLKGFQIGNYERSMMRYIRSELRQSRKIDKKRLFITHAGCPVRTIAQIKAEAEKLCKFDEVNVTGSSATVSGNCGPESIGILFVRAEC